MLVKEQQGDTCGPVYQEVKHWYADISEENIRGVRVWGLPRGVRSYAHK